MTRENWLQQRQKLITATDCLFIIKEFADESLRESFANVETYDRTRFQLYMEKVVAPDIYTQYQDFLASPAMKEGKEREAEIARSAEADLGFTLTPNGENLVVLEDHKLGATPDYLIENIHDPVLFWDAIKNKPEDVVIETSVGKIGGENDDEIIQYIKGLSLDKKGLLECKLTANLTVDKLIAYQIQVQQQLLCTGLEWACIAIAIKEDRATGSKIAKRHYYFMSANKSFHEIITRTVAEYWKWFDGVKSGTVEAPKPNIDNDKDKVLNTFLETDIAKLCENYMELRIAYEAQDKSFDAVKEKLKIYGKGETFNVTISDGSTYSIPITKTKETIWTDELKNKAITDAQNIEIGTVKTKSSLRIGSPKLI